MNTDGTWKSPQDQLNVFTALNNKRVNSRRIDSVSLAYKIMKLNPSRQVSSIFDQLDQTLYATPHGKIKDIGDRIKYLRNASGHGELADISGDSLFFGLITALVFYNQT